MDNMLDQVKENISSEFINESATFYGENETGIAKAISCIAPSILAGVLEKSGDSHSIDTIFSTLKNFDPSVANHLSALIGEPSQKQKQTKDTFAHLSDLIFGAKTPAITNAVASFSGVKQSSASALLGIGGPLVMALLSKKINEEGLNSSTLVRYLLAQKPIFMGVLPAGIASLLGLVNAGNNSNSEGSMSGKVWVWLILLLIGLVGIIIFFLKS
jgi:hypothetical protein